MSVYRGAGTIYAVARAFLREGRRLALRGLHLLGTRTAVVLGLLLAIVTGSGAVRNLWLSFTGTKADGVVVRQIEELSVDWRDAMPGPLGASKSGIRTAPAERLYRAVVDFQAGGKSYEVIANARATVHLYALGSKVEVVYPPGRPERARLRPELPDVWAQAGLLFVATLVGAGSGYTWWKLATRRAARRRVVKPAG
ncbi:MAG: DUF3592 domain-containing protein [Rhodospirillaceae bacterium]